MTAFEEWLGGNQSLIETKKAAWNAALEAAAKLAKEQTNRDTMIHGPVLCHAYCHQQDADAISALMVER